MPTMDNDYQNNDCQIEVDIARLKIDDYEFAIAQLASTSSEDSDAAESDRLADLVASARRRFPTRGALEDAIRARRAAGAEVCELLPLCLMLPGVADLTAMADALQVAKEQALRAVDMVRANRIQTEIEEVRAQLKKEEQYLLEKNMGGLEYAEGVFPTEKKLTGILKTVEMLRKMCGGGEKYGCDSRDDVECHQRG